MALPADINLNFPSWNFAIKPFKRTGNNDIYVVGINPANLTQIQIYASSDPVNVAFTSRGTITPEATFGIASLAVTQSGDVLYIASQTNNRSPRYSEFDMVNDVVNFQGVEIDGGVGDTADTSAVAIAVRSTGERVVIYQGHRNKDMGTERAKITWARSLTGGIWTFDIQDLHDPIDNEWFTGCSCVLGDNDTIHVHFRDGGGANGGTDFRQRAIRSDNTLGTLRIATNAIQATNYPLAESIAFTRTSTTKIMAPFKRVNPYERDYDSGTDPALGTERQIHADALRDETFGIAAFGDTVYALWVEDGDGNIYSKNDQGAFDWSGARTLELTGSVTELCCNIYNRGSGGDLLAYVYVDGGQFRYNEITISATPVTRQVITSLDGLLLAQGLTRQSNLDALLQATDLTRQVDFDAVLVAEFIKTALLDALLQAFDETRTANLDALLQALDQKRTASFDAALQRLGITRQVAFNAVLEGVIQKTAQLDAVLFKAADKRGAALDALLALTGTTVDISFDGALLKLGDNRIVSLDSLIQALGETRTVSFDASLVLVTKTVIVSLDAVIVPGAPITRTVIATLDALLQARDILIAAEMDGLLLKPDIKLGADLDALLVNLMNTLGLSFDSLLWKRDNKGVALDALVLPGDTDLIIQNIVGM